MVVSNLSSIPNSNCLGFDSQHTQIFSEELSALLRLVEPTEKKMGQTAEV